MTAELDDKGKLFQHTAARRRLDLRLYSYELEFVGFNTQPPEGGWLRLLPSAFYRGCFNTQPPEGGWENVTVNVNQAAAVSTHSRPKAAGLATKPSCST